MRSRVTGVAILPGETWLSLLAFLSGGTFGAVFAPFAPGSFFTNVSFLSLEAVAARDTGQSVRSAASAFTDASNVALVTLGPPFTGKLIGRVQSLNEVRHPARTGVTRRSWFSLGSFLSRRVVSLHALGSRSSWWAGPTGRTGVSSNALFAVKAGEPGRAPSARDTVISRLSANS